MPWTADDADRHKQGLSDRQKRQWAAVANSASQSCLDDGGDQPTCEASAIRQANAAVSEPANQNLHHYTISTKHYEVRQEMHQGRKHMVVPVVMMTEGVHHGTHGPLLHLIDDLGRFVAAWNGIPVTVAHPQEGEDHVSANQPHIIESQAVGRIYNAIVDDNRLRAEAWLDEEKLGRVSPEALQYIVEGRPLDVSVGVFTEDEPASGDWHDECYEGIARNHRPDHLALLPGGSGACSWADGCGVRAHAKGDVNVKDVRLNYNGTESTEWNAPNLEDFGVEGSNWADLSAADKAKVAGHYLVAPAGADFADLKFPVVNPETGGLNEQALRAVISDQKTPVDLPANVKDRARLQACRLLNDEFGADLEIPENLESQKEEPKVLTLKVKVDGDKAIVEDLQLVKALAMKGIGLNALGYREIAGKIQGKLDRMDSDTRVHFLEEVFDDHFIYRVAGRNAVMPSGEGEEFYKRAYQIDNDNSIEFTGEPQAVTKQVEYVVLTAQKEVTNMTMEKDKKCCPEKIQALIEHELTNLTEDDREWLEAMTEEQVDRLFPKKVESQEPPLQMNREQAIQVLKDELGDKDKFRGLLPADVREQMDFGLRAYQQERQRLIDHIKANAAEQAYSDEELAGMGMQALEKMARQIPAKLDYSGQAPATHQATPATYGEPLLPPGVEPAQAQ